MNISKRKIVIITAILVPEALEKTDKELEAEIRAELSSTDIPWCKRTVSYTHLTLPTKA